MVQENVWHQEGDKASPEPIIYGIRKYNKTNSMMNQFTNAYA